jgi:hypothetical protein
MKEVGMKKFGLLLAIAVLSMMLAVPAMAAPIRLLGIDTGTAWQYSTVTGLTNVASFTRVSEANFATVNLNDYDVLMVSETFQDGGVTVPSQSTLNALFARSNDIASWLQAGHGIVALSEPIGIGPYAWLPNNIQLGVSGVAMGNETVQIVDPSHPVMAGLTDGNLSAWGTSSHNWFFTFTGGLSILAQNGDGDPITLAGTYGAGRVVLTTQDADFHNFYNGNETSLRLVQNAVDWVSPVPEPSMVWLLTMGLVGVLGFRKKIK